jgi:glycosyltransferase involved in cell wall biosynthesis
MLSVVIPTRDCERTLVRTLAMLVSASVAGVVGDVVVADAGSSDDTAKIADMAGCTLLVLPAPLGVRLREGAAAARGSWLLFLRPGTVLDTTWAAEVERFIESAEQSGREDMTAVFRARPPGETDQSLARQALALVKEALRRGPRPEQGLVISRRYYESLGGHRAEASDPETDLLRRISYSRIVRLSHLITF